MTQHPHVTASNELDYDRTLILAVEVSGRSWVVAAQVPGVRQKGTKQQLAPCMGRVANSWRLPRIEDAGRMCASDVRGGP